MAKLYGGREGFREWVDKQASSEARNLPLTHICRGIIADDIFASGSIKISKDKVFDEDVAYLFYGRPAYRVGQEGVVKLESACPFCFVFRPEIIDNADAIFAFDTGAFAKRLYNNILIDDFAVEDFLLEKDHTRPNKLISATFGTVESYYDGNTDKIAPADHLAKPWEHHARAYLNLISSPGRNEPDDRVYSIEILFKSAVGINGNLLAVAVPHTHWNENDKAPWLQALANEGAEVLPYMFTPGRPPEHYHTLLEAVIRQHYKDSGIL